MRARTGAILLTATERRYELLAGFARCLVDDRAVCKLRHPLRDLLAQRIFGLACGQPDANDATASPTIPSTSCSLGRDTITREALASQPPIDRRRVEVQEGD